MNIPKLFVIIPTVLLFFFSCSMLSWSNYSSDNCLWLPVVLVLFASLFAEIAWYIEDPKLHLHRWTRWQKGTGELGSTCKSRVCKSCKQIEYKGEHKFIKTVDPKCVCCDIHTCAGCGLTSTTSHHIWGEEVMVEDCKYEQVCVRCHSVSSRTEHNYYDEPIDWDGNTVQVCARCNYRP